jgi:hypothetical protein
VNRPNKGRQLPAEAGEGRAQMKENIDQPHMLPIKTSGEFADHFVRLSHLPYYLLYLKKKRAVIFHLGERPFCLPR